jgi:hypothetical protein
VRVSPLNSIDAFSDLTSPAAGAKSIAAIMNSF